MFVHEALARALHDSVTRTVFGLMGDANLFVLDSYSALGGRYVATAHEAGAVLAAIGFARTSDSVGVASVTQGPGLTNSITALVEGVRARTPIVLLAGDTAAEDRENFQNIAQGALVLPTGAGFETARSPATVLEDLATSVRRATHERRPVVFNVPSDFMWQRTEYTPIEIRVGPRQAVTADLDAVDRALGVIASARRPIVLAGDGATDPVARRALLALARRVGAPVATTLKAKDLFRGEPNALGLFGTLAEPRSADAFAASDCVVAFGAGLNRWTTVDGGLVAGKALVHVDERPESIGRHTPATVGVVGDAAAVAAMFVDWLDREGLPTPTAPWTAAGADTSAGAPVAGASKPGTVDLVEAMDWIDAMMPRERTLVFDGGRFGWTAFRRLRACQPRGYVHTVNFGSIGLGMGHAIGAAFGAPDRPVLLASGDGGFMLGGIAELNTAVRAGIDLVVALFNDGAYGAEHLQFDRRGRDPRSAHFDWPDFAPVATALGAEAVTVRDKDDMRAVQREFAGLRRPLLIDIKIDPARVPSLH